MKSLKEVIDSVYEMEYAGDSAELFEEYIVQIKTYVKSNHLVRSNTYLDSLNNILDEVDGLSSFKSDSDRLLHKNIQRSIANIAKKIIEENKKIFIVHGRNISMRDKVSSLLGRLKLDYVILEEEYNGGGTIIEKFLRNAEECQYAIILFSADDKGGLKDEGSKISYRVRQNVILELGYFLGKIGRENLIILHETGISIETPSDYAGIVHEPFDEFGAWKSKLIKELKRSRVHIEQSLADRV